MRKIIWQEFIKGIVEKGTNDRYALLSAKRPMEEPLSIQKIMKEIISVKSNTCGHSYDVTVGEFIKNHKACKVCLLAHDRHISNDTGTICYSLHNTQAN